MSLRRYATRLSAASLSPFGEFLLRFVRTMILSHLLSPGDLGAAVVLTSILTGCEVITDIGLDKFVMVSRDGARAQVVAAARQISIARAVLLAAAIALLAPLLASAFGASEHHRIVAWLGVVPLIRSLKNWRIVQVQQDYRYGAEAVSNIGGHVAAVAAVMPAYALFHDERVMLVSLIVEAAVSVMLSYVLVPRERVAYVDPAIRRAALTFGLPLMANGVGLVVLKQLDQVIVANLFGLPIFALYSLVLNLAITPTSILQRVVWKIALPFLGKSRRDDAALSQASLIVILWNDGRRGRFCDPGRTCSRLACSCYLWAPISGGCRVQRASDARGVPSLQPRWAQHDFAGPWPDRTLDSRKYDSGNRLAGRFCTGAYVASSRGSAGWSRHRRSAVIYPVAWSGG